MKVIPGQTIGQDGIAAEGTFTRNNLVYASRIGDVLMQDKTFTIKNKFSKPTVNTVVICRVEKISQKAINVTILYIDDLSLGHNVKLEGQILHRDMIAKYEQYEVKNLFRPTDIIRAKVVCLQPMLLSTVDDNLGVLMAFKDGEQLIPHSWTEMKSNAGIFGRKVAKP